MPSPIRRTYDTPTLVKRETIPIVVAEAPTLKEP
jgi:hypothetical protein